METIELNSIDQLKTLISGSGENPVFLFKHSTRCPISHAAHDEYKNFVKSLNSDTIVCTDLDLLAHRDVSAAIAEQTGVTHQSPQAILVVDGEVKWSATHSQITGGSLQKAYTGI